MIHIFICMDRFDDELTNAICLNLLDQYAEVLRAFQHFCSIDQISVGTSMDQLLAISKTSGSKWGMFFRIGNHVTFSFMRNMVNNLRTADADTAVIGHVLDRGERYYELHEQAFILNLEKFRKTTDVQYTPTPGLKPVVERSSQNFHDGYTPIWVKPGTGMLDVTIPAPGADLVAFGLQEGSIRPFDDKERRGRFYMYPEWSFSDNLHRMEQQIAATQTKFFLFNTDPNMSEQFRGLKRVSRIVAPASGFMPFELARDIERTDDFRFVFFDSSSAATYLYRYMLNEWDGRDPRAIIGKSTAGPRCVVVDGDLDTLWTGMIDRFGGMSEWLSFFHTYKDRHHLYDLDIMTGYRRDHFVNSFHGCEDDVIYSLTNIYWYEPTSFLRSHATRTRQFNEHLTYLQQYSPNVTVYYSMPGITYVGKARAATPYEPMDFPWRHENLSVATSSNVRKWLEV